MFYLKFYKIRLIYKFCFFFTFLNSFIPIFHVVAGDIEYLPNIYEGLDMFLNSTYN